MACWSSRGQSGQIIRCFRFQRVCNEVWGEERGGGGREGKGGGGGGGVQMVS